MKEVRHKKVAYYLIPVIKNSIQCVNYNYRKKEKWFPEIDVGRESSAKKHRAILWEMDILYILMVIVASMIVDMSKAYWT